MSAQQNTESIEVIGNVLLDESKPLKERFRSLFTLKNLGGQDAIDSISKAFTDPSALLKHECAYCLGQMQDEKAIPILTKVLEDTNQDPMVRHEAGEALGAIGSKSVESILQKYANDPQVEVAETCQLALHRIQWLHTNKEDQEKLPQNPYSSVDPAPPSQEKNVEQLKDILLNEQLELFQRYRAMFSLRNIGSKESVLALAEGLKCKSALFRHEIAYVLGQMQHEAATEQLTINLQKENESPMVRHECAEALGSIANEKCMAVLGEYLKDNERVVKESCEVALDMCEYENSKEFQYADSLQKIENSTGPN